jgi:hypothetical protein
MMTLIYGHWMKSIFNNTVRGVECGCHPTSGIQCCFIILQGKVLAILGQSGCVMVSLYTSGKNTASTLRVSFPFSRDCDKEVLAQDEG